MALKSSSDFEMHTKMLNKLDSDNDVTLDKLSRDCQSIINLKADTVLIENNQKVNVNKVKVKSSNNTYKTERKVPQTLCWYCGDFHYARFCPYQKHKYGNCAEIGQSQKVSKR